MRYELNLQGLNLFEYCNGQFTKKKNNRPSTRSHSVAAPASSVLPASVLSVLFSEATRVAEQIQMHDDDAVVLADFTQAIIVGTSLRRPLRLKYPSGALSDCKPSSKMEV